MSRYLQCLIRYLFLSTFKRSWIVFSTAGPYTNLHLLSPQYQNHPAEVRHCNLGVVLKRGTPTWSGLGLCWLSLPRAEDERGEWKGPQFEQGWLVPSNQNLGHGNNRFYPWCSCSHWKLIYHSWHFLGGWYLNNWEIIIIMAHIAKLV